MPATAPDRSRLLHLSLVVGGELLGAAGERLGRLDDLVVRLGEDYPPLTGLLCSVARRQVFVSGDAVATLEHGRVRLSTDRLDLRAFDRRSREVLLRADVLDRQLIDVDGARLRRANDIELARLGGWWCVVGVDVGPRGVVRRIVPRRYAPRVGGGRVLDWTDVEPFTGHVPSLRLRVPHPKLTRLHPAELADLVESASHREGAEILAAVHSDPELEADLFEELETPRQREFLDERSDGEIAAVLARMESDDAADLALSIDDERRERIVELLPTAARRRLRTLLGFDPATAGGMMNPDFVCVYGQATVEEALDRVRLSRGPAELLANVFVMNTQRRLHGAIPLADLVRANPDATMTEVAPPPRTVPLDAGLEEVARLMADYDLTVVGVVDDERRLQGAVTVDDVLELVLPRGWRRPFGLDEA